MNHVLPPLLSTHTFSVPTQCGSLSLCICHCHLPCYLSLQCVTTCFPHFSPHTHSPCLGFLSLCLLHSPRPFLIAVSMPSQSSLQRVTTCDTPHPQCQATLKQTNTIAMKFSSYLTREGLAKTHLCIIRSILIA